MDKFDESKDVGPYVTVTKNGGRHTDVGRLLADQRVQAQLRACHKLVAKQNRVKAHPPAGILYTAEEIAEQYGRTEEKR